MKAARTFLIAVSFVALTAVVPAQMASGGEVQYSKKQVQYSKKQIREMMRDAHTPEQYRVLGEWFRSQEQMFDEKAAAEKKEWEQRVGGYKVDPARNLYDYYVEEAKETGARAAEYERLSQ